ALRIQLLAAVKTFSAWDMVEHDDPVAGLIFFNARTDRCDPPGGFMPIDTRAREQVIGDLLQIRGTDAAAFDADENFPGPDLGYRHRLHRNHARPFIHGGLHGRKSRFYGRESRI